ncbi:DUF2975 domain-containing protein [Bacillus salacetis]|uniref:DUF2975 domain-containing protein n=1 Tax=Bacillus salacetis TaxID=2315464 RepID=A0A3A1R457_9BACI|nr:DUF2975 domain-containing protein [Bacillus salacetis]
MQHSTTLFLKSALGLIGLTVLALCIFWLPQQAVYFAEIAPEFSHLQFPVLFGIYLSAAPFFFALCQTYVLLNLIEKNQTFTGASIKALNYILNCALLIVLLFLAGIIYLISQSAGHPGILLLGLIIIFSSSVIAVFSAVLQKLLKSAIVMKADNDSII